MQYPPPVLRMPDIPDTEEKLLALRLHEGTDDLSARILAAQNGDAEARKWLAARWTPEIFRFCYRMLGNEQDGRDACQETMVKVLRTLDRYDRTRSFRPWILRIARNTCIDELRRRKRRAWDEPGEVVDRGPTPHERTSAAQRAQQLHAAIQHLSPLYREVLVMYHFEHLKYREIADALELPIGTVMNRIFRARQKLREQYVSQGGVL